MGTEFDQWITSTNQLLKKNEMPFKVHNLTTVWTIIFTIPGRYHWMFQYYLRAEGIALSWVGCCKSNQMFKYHKQLASC